MDASKCHGMPVRRTTSLNRNMRALCDQVAPAAVRVSIGDSNALWDYQHENLHECTAELRSPSRDAA